MGAIARERGECTPIRLTVGGLHAMHGMNPLHGLHDMPDPIPWGDITDSTTVTIEALAHGEQRPILYFGREIGVLTRLHPARDEWPAGVADLPFVPVVVLRAAKAAYADQIRDGGRFTIKRGERRIAVVEGLAPSKEGR